MHMAAIVGALTVDLLVVDSNSLKDKRQVIKSLLDGIRNRFNVSAAELGELDTWRRAVIGVAVISNDRNTANTVLNHVLSSIESNPRVTVAGCEMEFL
jgi:hypothetical protein